MDKDKQIEELRRRVAYLEEEVAWRTELIRSRTASIYQLIQQAQDALMELPEGMVQ